MADSTYCLHTPAHPPSDDYWLTLLDVGQGLSAIIQTHNHVMVYDTGAKFAGDDMAERVILPYLRHIFVKQIDLLVVSHGDNDHIGGASTLLHSLPIKSIKTSVPEKFPNHLASFCQAEDHWEWDGVRFTFLYPQTDRLAAKGNDQSCVLLVESAYKRTLLTGDIEKNAEKLLLQDNRSKLAADILIAPHHGSKTSMVPGFIAAVKPRYVLYGVGYHNRYHLPNAKVLAAYEALHAQQFLTSEAGAIFFKTGIKPILHRFHHHHYWYDDPE